jgi:hypothetical protein
MASLTLFIRRQLRGEYGPQALEQLLQHLSQSLWSLLPSLVFVGSLLSIYTL